MLSFLLKGNHHTDYIVLLQPLNSIAHFCNLYKCHDSTFIILCLTLSFSHLFWDLCMLLYIAVMFLFSLICSILLPRDTIIKYFLLFNGSLSPHPAVFNLFQYCQSFLNMLLNKYTHILCYYLGAWFLGQLYEYFILMDNVNPLFKVVAQIYTLIYFIICNIWIWNN